MLACRSNVLSQYNIAGDGAQNNAKRNKRAAGRNTKSEATDSAAPGGCPLGDRPPPSPPRGVPGCRRPPCPSSTPVPFVPRPRARPTVSRNPRSPRLGWQRRRWRRDSVIIQCRLLVRRAAVLLPSGGRAAEPSAGVGPGRTNFARVARLRPPVGRRLGALTYQDRYVTICSHPFIIIILNTKTSLSPRVQVISCHHYLVWSVLCGVNSRT